MSAGVPAPCPPARLSPAGSPARMSQRATGATGVTRRPGRSRPATRAARAGSAGPLEPVGPACRAAAHAAGSRLEWTSTHPGPPRARPVAPCWATTTTALPCRRRAPCPSLSPHLRTRRALISQLGPTGACDVAARPSPRRRRARGPSRRALVPDRVRPHTRPPGPPPPWGGRSVAAPTTVRRRQKGRQWTSPAALSGERQANWRRRGARTSSPSHGLQHVHCARTGVRRDARPA